jgi:hypothetical protein
VEEGVPELGRLSDPDLQALRLGAEVMGHKALAENRPLVADYFRRLENTLRARIAGADSADDDSEDGGTLPGVDPSADTADRVLIADYLGLLATNDRLSPELRDVCRQLRARDGA